jgi:hypothetical protein
MSRLAFVAILAVAALLRLVGLGRMSFWMDEGFTVVVATAPWSQLGSTAVGLEKHPIGSYIFAKLGLLVMNGELGLRWPSALFGIVTVAVFYPLAKEVLAREDASYIKPLAATGLCAVLAMLVLANRDARSYSPAILGITVATLAWSLASRCPAQQRTKFWGIWVVAGLGAAYCHYFAFVVLGLQWLTAVVAQPRVLTWWLTLPAVALAYLPALPRLLFQAAVPVRGHPEPGWHDLFDVFFSQTVGFTLNFSSLWVWYCLAICGLVGALAGSMKAGPLRQVGIVYWGFVAIIFGVPVRLPLSLFEMKYFVLVSPLFILLVTEALFLLPWQSVRWAAWAALVALNLTSTLNAICYSEWHRQDFRGAVEVVVKNAQPGDAMVLEPDWLEPVVRYYLGVRANDLKLLPVAPADSLKFSASRLNPGHRVWVLRAALATPASQVLAQLSLDRRPLMHWKSYRRAPLLQLDLFLFSQANAQLAPASSASGATGSGTPNEEG